MIIHNMLRLLMDKVGSMQGQMGNVKQRDGNPKKEPKRNIRDKHCNRNKE